MGRLINCVTILITSILILCNSAWALTPSNEFAGTDATSLLNYLKQLESSSRYVLGQHTAQNNYYMTSGWDETWGQMLTDTGHYPAFVGFYLKENYNADDDYSTIEAKVIEAWNNNAFTLFHTTKCNPFLHPDTNSDNKTGDTNVCLNTEGMKWVIPSGYTLADVYTHPGNPAPCNFGQAPSAYCTHRTSLVQEAHFIRDLWDQGVGVLIYKYNQEQEGSWYWEGKNEDLDDEGEGDQGGFDEDGTSSAHFQGFIQYTHNFFEDSYWYPISSESGTFDNFETVTMYTNSDCSTGATGATGIYNEDDGSEVYIQLIAGSVSANDYICGDRTDAYVRVSSSTPNQQGLPNMLFAHCSAQFYGDSFSQSTPRYDNIAGLQDYIDVEFPSHGSNITQEHLPAGLVLDKDPDQAGYRNYIEDDQSDPTWTLTSGKTYTYQTRAAPFWKIRSIESTDCYDGQACDEKKISECTDANDCINQVEADMDGAFFYNYDTGIVYLHTPNESNPESLGNIQVINVKGLYAMKTFPDIALGAANFVHGFGDINSMTYSLYEKTSPSGADAFLDDIDTYYPQTSIIFHWRTCHNEVYDASCPKGNDDCDAEDTPCDCCTGLNEGNCDDKTGGRMTTGCWVDANAYVNDPRTIHADSMVCLAPGQTLPANGATGIDHTSAINFVDDGSYIGPRALAGGRVKVYLQPNKTQLVYTSAWDITTPHTVTIPGYALEGNQTYYWTFIHGIDVNGSLRGGGEQTTPYWFQTVGAPPAEGGLVALLNGTYFTYRYCVFDGEDEEVTAVKITGANHKIYNSTIVHAGIYGFDADENVEFKNSILNNNAGGDIDIAATKTVTASNNSIEDSAKSGDGTYSSGTSDFSKTEVFYGYFAGDYRLRRSSYSVDAAIATLYGGIIYDILGKAVTDGAGDPISGAGLDIGAFESNPFLQGGPMGMGLGFTLN